MSAKMLATLLVFVLATRAVVAHAQQPKKLPLIGYLSSGTATSDAVRAEAIRGAMGERGYRDGQNIAIEYRYGESKIDRAPELAAELVSRKVDIILVAGGPVWVRAAKNATKTIPTVMTGGGTDPVEAGLIDCVFR